MELSGIEPLAFPACRDALLAIRLRFFDQFLNRMVELSGIEPLASSLRTRRSPS